MRFFCRRAAVLSPLVFGKSGSLCGGRVAPVEVENIAHARLFFLFLEQGGLTSQGFKNFCPRELLRPEPRVNLFWNNNRWTEVKKQTQRRERGENVKNHAEGLFGFQRFSCWFLSRRLHLKREPYVWEGGGEQHCSDMRSQFKHLRAWMIAWRCPPGGAWQGVVTQKI